MAFLHSKFYFVIRTEAWKLYFNVQKSYFDTRIGHEYLILTIKILFWNSSLGWVSYFDLKILILSLELGPNITFWRLNAILTFELGPKIVFWHSKSFLTFQSMLTIIFWLSNTILHSNSGQLSHFDIQGPILILETETEYRILTLKIQFWHPKLGQISYFNIQYPILTFKLRPNIVIWLTKSYFDIETGAEYRILTFKILLLYSEAKYRILTLKILFWQSNWPVKSHFDIQILFDIGTEAKSRILIQNPVLTFEMRPNILFEHSNSYFDIRTEAEYHILIFNIIFWRSNRGRISYIDIQNPILTFDLRPSIVFWHLKSYLTFKTRPNIAFWHLKCGRSSSLDIQNPSLTFKLKPNMAFWHSKFYFDHQTEAEYSILTFKILYWHPK